MHDSSIVENEPPNPPSHTPATQHDRPCYFMLLPVEVRLKIYAYLVPSYDRPHRIVLWYCIMGMSILESNTYAIYRVCKTITRELWPVYQSLVVEIVCPEDATVFRDHIAELANRGFRKENVQRLSVGSSPRNTMYPSDASLTKLMRNVSQQFTGLQELKLEGEEPARRMVPRLRAALRQVIQRNTGLTHIAQVTIDVPGVVGDQLRADLRGWLRTG